jgi:hypothetical protein
MRRSRFLVFLSLTTHFIPMSATIVLLILNLRGYYIGGELSGPSGLDDIKLPALQLAAKLHELSMQASLSLIVVSIVRHRLAFGPGIPFGMIFGSLQLSSISYLWSKEFFGTFRARFQSTFTKWILILLIVVGSVLFVSVGPSSAIAMRPRLDDWSAGGGDFYLNATENQIWPTSFTGSDVPLDCATISVTTDCISKDWKGITNSVLPFWSNLRKKTTTMMPDSFTITSAKSVKEVGIRHRLGRYRARWTLSTVQMSNLADAVAEISGLWIHAAGQFRRFRFRKDVTWSIDKIYQPVTMVTCLTHWNITVADIREKKLFVPNIGSSCNASTPAPAPSFDDIDALKPALSNYNSSTSNAPLLQFIDLPINDFGSNSIGVFVTFPDSWPGGKGIVGCAIDARWAPTKIKSRRSRVKFITGSMGGWVERGTCFSSNTKRITLDESWANFLNPIIQDYNRTVFHEILRSIPPLQDEHGVDDKFLVSPLVESIISVMVTTSLANTEASAIQQGILKGCTGTNCSERCGEWGGSWCKAIMPRNEFGNGKSIYNLPPNFDKSKAAHFTLHATINGYAYNSSGRATILSCVVLICYCVMVIVHMLFSMRIGLCSQAWDTVSEVVALAMQSRPTEKLRNTCAGIVSKTTFTHLVRVRRTGEVGEHLELLFEDGQSAGCLAPDEFYE